VKVPEALKAGHALWLWRQFGTSWIGYRLLYALMSRVGYTRFCTPTRRWSANESRWGPKRVPSLHGAAEGVHDQEMRLRGFLSPEQWKGLHERFEIWDVHQQGLGEGCADFLKEGVIPCFSRHWVRLGYPPDWHLNWQTGNRVRSDAHWSTLGDFSSGDIKLVWETSRFSFAFDLVRGYGRSGDERYVEVFWELVESWRHENPPNHGVHWKCGQEVALRMISWVFAWMNFRQCKATTATRERMLAEMVRVSAQRIEGNIAYALSQHNNHGISEATGLFTAGLVLGERRWIVRGRQLLERLALQLIYDDGSFAQHSANYHRLMLHDFLWAIQWGRFHGVTFSSEVLGRVCAAGRWLLAFMDRQTGRVPNLGANDGALVLPLSNCGYLDYRPTVQAVGKIVEGRAWLPEGPWDELAMWLGARETGTCLGGTQDGCRVLSEGGYAVFRAGGLMAMFRCPTQLRHRPSHCDLLHFDLWCAGTNILRDSGTYSYNCEEPWQSYFSGTAAHNTVEFDERDQMPRLSRFLFGRWPTLVVEDQLGSETPTVTAHLVDWKGCRHSRTVILTSNGFRIIDRIEGFQRQAVLRWRLAPEWNWRLDGSGCRSEGCTIRLTAKPGPVNPELTIGWESLYYFEKTELPVLQAAFEPGLHEITTEVVIHRC
jgi:hypothetical protein